MVETLVVFAAVVAAVCAAFAAVYAFRAYRALDELAACGSGTKEAIDRVSESQGAANAALNQLAVSIHGVSMQVSNASVLEQQHHEEVVRTVNAGAEKADTSRKETNQRLDYMREGVDRQLDTIRATVDERLAQTLNDRLGASFKQVSDQLEAVYRGLGDMQNIAQGVGDLKRVLTNVKTRGILGEVQLGAILADILAPEQYVQNVATKPGSAERVEFAVRIPVEGSEPVLLPIDAKFPGDAYEHLRDAIDAGDTEGIASARKQLELRIRTEARDISTKYLSVPETTNFAIMFLPFEGLYAEVVDMPGLVEAIQRDYQVSVAGPSTMAAILNSLQMSYQSFAFQRQADEIQRVLSAVKAELPRYQAALQKAYEQINRAGSTVETLITTRTRAIERKLKGVTALESEAEALHVLGFNEGGRSQETDEVIFETPEDEGSGSAAHGERETDTTERDDA